LSYADLQRRGKSTNERAWTGRSSRCAAQTHPRGSTLVLNANVRARSFASSSSDW
jgi:hypothetical protein